MAFKGFLKKTGSRIGSVGKNVGGKVNSAIDSVEGRIQEFLKDTPEEVVDHMTQLIAELNIATETLKDMSEEYVINMDEMTIAAPSDFTGGAVIYIQNNEDIDEPWSIPSFIIVDTYDAEAGTFTTSEGLCMSLNKYRFYVRA